MEKLKIFNQNGEAEFSDFLIQLKTTPSLEKINLSDPKYYEIFQPEIEVDESKMFSSRIELAEYLTKTFNDAGIKRKDVIGKNKFWTWLTYLWFDQVCPNNSGGRKVKEMVKYICSSDPFKYYRHFIASTYNIYSILGKENSLLFLYPEVNVHNDFIEQLASRQEIISRGNLIKAAHELYWDKKINKPKPAATDRKKQGNLRRLIKIFGQIELTYDIFSMKSDEITSLLPKEFNTWRN